MKKGFLLLLILLSAASPSWADKTVMNNRWGYSYYNYVNLTNLSFQDILANNATNAVFVYNATANFDHVDFKNNTSHGLYLHAVNGPITLNNMYFYNNTGGAASFWQGQQAISNSIFNNNSHTDGFGGALYIPNRHKLTANNVSFSDNSAAQGGAIYAGNDLIIQGGNLMFSNNAASQGGGIYAANDLTLSATDGDIVFSGNIGGDIYMASGTLTLQPVGGDIIFTGDILSPSQVSIVVAGSNKAQVKFNHAFSKASVTLQAGTAYFTPADSWTGMTLNAAGGSLYLTDSSVHKLILGNVNLHSNLHIVPEVNLQTDTMDSLHIANVSGPGDITVDQFNLLAEDTQHISVMDFMTGTKPNVNIPRTVNGSIYAYDVFYNQTSGQITFVPKSPEVSGSASANSTNFNPAVLSQPLRSYMVLYMLQNSMSSIRHRKQSRFLHYEDVASSFYLSPYLNRGKIKFINNLQTDTSLSGVQAGWTSADWGITDDFAITGGFNVGFMSGNNKYQNMQMDISGYQAGGELNVYSESFWFGLAGQTAAISSDVLNDTQNEPAFWSEATLQYYINWTDNGWIFAPYAQVGYGFSPKADGMWYAGNMLKGSRFSLIQLQGGVAVIKSYNDVWHWYVDGTFVKQTTNADDFYAGAVSLPDFKANPFVQLQAGFQTENDGRFVLGGALTGSFGAVQQVGAQLTLQF